MPRVEKPTFGNDNYGCTCFGPGGGYVIGHKALDSNSFKSNLDNDIANIHPVQMKYFKFQLLFRKYNLIFERLINKTV